jgi:hypothetical protein
MPIKKYIFPGQSANGGLMQRNNKDRLAAVCPKSDWIWSRSDTRNLPFDALPFRVYFQSTGALSGVSEFNLGAGW